MVAMFRAGFPYVKTTLEIQYLKRPIPKTEQDIYAFQRIQK